MKKFAFSLLILCFIILVSGAVCFADAPSSDYQLLINDDFSGNELNLDLWSYRVGAVSGGKNKKENIRVADGKLFIDYVLRDGIYTGGGIISVDCLGYGYYETKAKVYDGAHGLHTSFWNSGGGGDRVGKYHAQDNRMIEIDGFEFNSNETNKSPVPAYNLHYWWKDPSRSGGSSRYDVETDGDESTPDWFTMGFEYLPDKVIYYANGKEIGRNDLSMYGMAHLKLTALAQPDTYQKGDGTLDIDNSKADENGYFGSSEYEYVKYYQKKLKGVNLFGNGHFEFNRTNTTVPKCFYYENNAIINFSPYARDGVCYASLTGESRMGQKIAYLLGGNYTLGGYFKTFDNADARLVVYDKNDNEIKSIKLPDCGNSWTYVAMTDIPVTDYAFAVVETKSGIIAIDDFEFFCQEGDDRYINYHDSDYETAPAFEHNSNYLVKYPDSAEKSAHSWGSSTITGVDSSYVATSMVSSSANYKNVWGSYTINVQSDDIYDLEVYRVLYENNVGSQTYSVTLDDVEVCDPVTLQTYSADPSNDIVKLCTFTAKKGQVVKVKITCNDFGGFALGSKYFRVTPVQLASQTDKLMETAIVTYISSPYYQYANSPYAFDKNDESIVPYKENGEFYIPYQAIKNVISLPDVADDAEYVSASEISSNASYEVAENGTIIIIYDSKYTASELLITTAYTKLTRFSGSKPSNFANATYVGTADEKLQEVYGISNCLLYGTWGNSSLGYNSSSRYASGVNPKAIWSVYPERNQKYSLQVYSIAYDGSGTNKTSGTTSAGVSIIVGKEQCSYAINQRDAESGWYDLGTFDLTKDTTIIFNMHNRVSSGQVRVSAVRLVPIFEDPEFIGTHDMAYQEYYGFESASTVGTWKQTGSGSLQGCYYGSGTDASITWSPVPTKSGNYKIQLYNPCIEQQSTPVDASVTLSIDGEYHYWTLSQRKPDSEKGWYDLGSYNLTPQSDIALTINKGSTSYLRAKAIRLVPVLGEPEFVGTADIRNQEYFHHTEALKEGTWDNSSGTLSGTCYGENNPSITWTLYPSKKNNYNIQVYIPCYNLNATTSDAKLSLILNNVVYEWTVNQFKDFETGSGWYDLGKFALNPDTPATISLKIGDGKFLRAKSVRLIPEPTEPLFVGKSDIANQEYFGYDTAVKVGTWKGPSSGALSGCYYGSSGSSISWTPTASTTGTYNIQIFSPCYNQNSTTKEAVITLTVDGIVYTASLNQYKSTDEHTGWYDLGTFDLTPASDITLTLTGKASGFLRAKAIRLVPLAEKPSATKSSASVILNLGKLSACENVLLLKECDASGRIVNSIIIKNSDVFSSIPLLNIENDFTFFLWESLTTMKPLTEPIK